MTALDTSKVKLLRSVVTELIGKVKDSSTIAALSTAQPEVFADTDHLIFNPSAEAEVVAEGAKKGSYDQALTAVTGRRVKVVTTTRVTDGLRWADDDSQLEIVKNIMADQKDAIGRALDLVVYHAINPKGGAALDGYTALCADGQASKVTATDDPVADIDALIEYSINGFAMCRKLASDLRKLRVPSTGQRLYPEIPLSLAVGALDGIPAAVSNTVNAPKASSPTKVLGIMGDLSLIKWGMVRDMWSEVIEYGDPDQSGVDLKANNQVAFRTEAVFAYAVLDPKGFAVLKSK